MTQIQSEWRRRAEILKGQGPKRPMKEKARREIPGCSVDSQESPRSQAVQTDFVPEFKLHGRPALNAEDNAMDVQNRSFVPKEHSSKSHRH